MAILLREAEIGAEVSQQAMDIALREHERDLKRIEDARALLLNQSVEFIGIFTTDTNAERIRVAADAGIRPDHG